MKIAIPVSQSDIHLLKPLCDVIIGLGGIPNRSVMIAPTPSVADQAAEIAESLRAVSRSYLCRPIPIEPEGGWPLAPNQHFGHLIQSLVETDNKEAFMVMEPDCTPTQPAWDDDLFTEYNLKKKPFMGHLRKTSEVWLGEEGHHMVGGCAIYHPNFHLSTTLWQYPRKDQPYDVLLRWVIVGDVGNDPKQHAFDTKLIQHLRRTDCYEQDGDVILAHDCKRDDDPKFVGRTYSVSPEAVIVHGCRDSSLANIVLKSLGLQPSCGTEEQAQRDAQTQIDAKKQQEINDRALYERVRGTIGDKMTLKALSEALCMDKKELRMALEKPDSPFVVRPPILWVSLKE